MNHGCRPDRPNSVSLRSSNRFFCDWLLGWTPRWRRLGDWAFRLWRSLWVPRGTCLHLRG